VESQNLFAAQTSDTPDYCSRRAADFAPRSSLEVENRYCPDRRAGALAPFQRQSNEPEFALPDQCFQIAEAFDMRDAEVETRFVHERVYLAVRTWPHRVDAEMHNALLRQPLGRRDGHAGIVSRVVRPGESACMVTGAKEHRAPLRDRHTGLLYRGVEVCRRDLCLRRDMAQVDADARHDAVFKRILVDRYAVHAEVARRIDVCAAVVGHGEEHHHVAVDVSGIDEGFFVRLPDAVDDRRLAWIIRCAVIEVAAEIDDAHC
jgi:hypothetical protein